MVVHTSNPRTSEEEEGGSLNWRLVWSAERLSVERVPSQSELHSETQSVSEKKS